MVAMRAHHGDVNKLAGRAGVLLNIITPPCQCLRVYGLPEKVMFVFFRVSVV
jgi:hypothetical protein